MLVKLIVLGLMWGLCPVRADIADIATATLAAVDEAVVGALLGPRGEVGVEGQVWVCASGTTGRGRSWSCEAALWQRRWVAARASCLAEMPAAPPQALRVLRHKGHATCEHLLNVNEGVKAPCARRVVSVRVHPVAGPAAAAGQGQGRGRGRYDLVLLQLDRPFDQPVHLANRTVLYHDRRDLLRWMEQVSSDRDQALRDVPANPHYLLSSRLLLFLSTMVLPAALFMGLFLFVTFCTGTPIKVPYANVDSNEITTHYIRHEYKLAVPNGKDK